MSLPTCTPFILNDLHLVTEIVETEARLASQINALMLV